VCQFHILLTKQRKRLALSAQQFLVTAFSKRLYHGLTMDELPDILQKVTAWKWLVTLAL